MKKFKDHPSIKLTANTMKQKKNIFCPFYYFKRLFGKIRETQATDIPTKIIEKQ